MTHEGEHVHVSILKVRYFRKVERQKKLCNRKVIVGYRSITVLNKNKESPQNAPKVSSAS